MEETKKKLRRISKAFLALAAVQSMYLLILLAAKGAINIADWGLLIVMATAAYYGFTYKNEKDYYAAAHYMAKCIIVFCIILCLLTMAGIPMMKNREQITINVIQAVWYIASARAASVYDKLISKLNADSSKGISRFQ